MQAMGWPDFVIIGAGRAGTTSLYQYLAQHPEVYVSPTKETNYFAYDPTRSTEDIEEAGDLFPVRSAQAYMELFQARTTEKAAGEASPRYLFTEGTERRIKAAVPDVRIVAILRDPVDRAYSAYLKYVRDGVERRSFGEAVEDELAGRYARSFSGIRNYLRIGLYSQHLARYHAHFPREQMTVLLFDDFQSNPEGTMTRLFRFLGVDEGFVPDCTIRYNPSGIPRNRGMHRFLTGSLPARLAKKLLFRPGSSRWLAPILALQEGNLEKPPLSLETRKSLIPFFADDLQSLQDLIGKDLGHWMF
jgi:hypothetical protein